MMDRTDRHCRYFFRQLSPNAGLYTEMITAAALIHGDAEKLLRFDPSEHPLALQLGGSKAGAMAKAAAVGAATGYDEININVGCPSDRVQDGQFGACLMARPALVADCFKAMQDSATAPISIKTRIGIDDHDSYEFLAEFVALLSAAGCRHFVVHARKAILQGLSPKQNRTVPPLNYERVYQLKRDYPALTIVLNGGVTSAAQVSGHLQQIDGVMIGRQAYHHPYLLAELEQQFLSGRAVPSRQAVVECMLPYVEAQLTDGAKLKHISRHMLGLFAGQPGARSWRRYLSKHSYRAGAGPEVLEQALVLLPIAA